MGVELDKLLQHYAIKTPALATYAGAIDPTPYRSQLSTQTFNYAMNKYMEDKDTYDRYKREYERRLQTTPMYGPAQPSPILGNPLHSGYKLIVPAPAPPPAPAPAPPPPPPTYGREWGDVYNSRPASGPLLGGVPAPAPSVGNVPAPAPMPSFGFVSRDPREKTVLPTLPTTESFSARDGFKKGGLAEQEDGLAEEEDTYPERLAVRQAQNMAGAMPQAQQPMSLEQLMAQYMQPSSQVYTSELATARSKANTETEAFHKLLQDSIKQVGTTGPSKSEMYFRLAAAFAEPGKTGSFGEGLGRAAGVMAEHRKAERDAQTAAAQRRLQLGLTAQQARMSAAQEDVSSLRTLAAEEEKSRRATQTEMLKEWVKRNDPESAAGKQARDEGLRPGTPQFQKRVREISEMAVDRANAQIQASLTGMNVAMANLGLAQKREERAAETAKKLTPQEVKLKTETEDSMSSIDSAMQDLAKAYKLNPNAFDTSGPDTVRRKLLEASGSKDAKLVNTRELENLLKSQTITTAAEKMKGVLSDSDIKLLSDIQGLDAKSVEERGRILMNGYKVLQRGREKIAKRLADINAGRYRETTPAGSE